MHARHLAFSLAPLLASSLAYAQAPGEFVPPPPAGPAPENPCAAPCGGCSHAESVMENRWAVGLSLGQMSLAPDGQSDNQTVFGLGELSLRFRATPHFELELAVGGGREQLADNQEGDLEVNTAMIAARYRFRPEAAWNWYVMGGLGGASITRHDATKQERDDATQPLGMLGIGLERRFHHFALQAEARAIGIGDKNHNDDKMIEPTPVAEPGGMATVETPTATPSQKQSGGSLTIGLSYYF
jgi:opacity protein-like surface antigen